MEQRVNYDTIAHLYDEPLRDHRVDPALTTFLGEKGIAPAAATILDVGCGTGKQLAANREAYPSMTLVGLDRFGQMLRLAAERCPTAMWVQGDGATLPFASRRFDYVTNQFSYQHIRNTEALLGEVFRVLKPGARFVMHNIDPWSMEGWIIYRYFPAARDLDFIDFIPAERFLGLMRETGFSDIKIHRSELTRRETLEDFFEYASGRHRASQFIAIPDDAYRKGIQRIQQDIAEARSKEASVVSELVLVTVAGDRV